MLFVDILGLIGTSAFTISGVLVGIKNRLDLFGLFVLAVFTASGGGLVRDIILNNGLPVLFTQPKYFIIILVSTLITFATFRFLTRIYNIILIFDAIGLGVFTVLAAYNCILMRVPLIGIIFISTLTGVGGGIIRDILVNDVPLVFRSEIYALASVVGALIFYFLYDHIETNLNIYLNILIVFAIRMVSIYFKINLPYIKAEYKQN